MFEGMTKEQAYDYLLMRKVIEPAVVPLIGQFVVGRWESVSETLPDTRICRVGKVGIVVMGRGDTLAEAMTEAVALLERQNGNGNGKAASAFPPTCGSCAKRPARQGRSVCEACAEKRRLEMRKIREEKKKEKAHG